MAKRRKNSFPIIPLLTVASCILGLAAVVMIFLPTIGIKDTDKTYTGLQIAFGYSNETLGVKTTVFNFSFMNFLRTYLHLRVQWSLFWDSLKINLQARCSVLLLQVAL